MTNHGAILLLAIACVACRGEEAREHTAGSTGSGSLRVVSIPNSQLISESGIGPIKLGVSLDSAKKIEPQLAFSRTSDGEGVALVLVTIGPDSLIAYLGEEDPSAPVNTSKPVRSLETMSPNYYAEQGVHAGSLVTDVEKVYGPTKDIFKSEIESREFITFASQPPKLQLRLDSGTGIFAPDSTTTTRFTPGARIFSISVSIND